MSFSNIAQLGATWGGNMGFRTLALGLSFTGLFVAASAFGSSELIVRYREPQNNAFQAYHSMVRATGKDAQVGILNSEEGVVKLSFATPEEAAAARDKLLASDRVLSVAPNFYYRPAMRLQVRTVEGSENEWKSVGFLPLPFVGALARSGLMAGMPEVQLPGSVVPGADPLAKQDWALKNIRMPSVAALTSDSSPLIAAVIDTGVDYNHEDLVQAMWRKPGNPKEVGYDFAHKNARPYDLVHFDIEGCLNDPGCSLGFDTAKFLSNPGHGTHCAGHVGAMANNSIGMTGIGAPADVKVMGLKFFYDAGEPNAGAGDDAAAIQSIDYAVKNGAKVISASWGGAMPREEAEKSELKNALIRAQKAGVLVVIAAGNDGIDQDRVTEPAYPAAYDLDNLIVVAATDQKDSLADFSNYGAKSVHIGAPGVKILSTTVGSKYSDLVAKFKGKDGKEHEIAWDGTSMATPIVAGAAALIWSKYPNENYKQIRDRILRTARKVPGLNGRVQTGGVLDVAAALGTSGFRR